MIGRIFIACALLAVFADAQTCNNALLVGTTYICPTGTTVNGTLCCTTGTTTTLTDCNAALLVGTTYVCPASLIVQGSQCCNATTTTTTTTTSCVDLVRASTGVSDCPSRAYLCNNAVYYTLMTQQCPRTCGRCNSTSTTTVTSSSTCVDLVNPTTGVSDCPSLSYLCTSAAYVTLMRTQCRLTCGFCTSG